MVLARSPSGLPRWVTSNQVSLTREAAAYVAMTPSERAAVLDLLCRDAELILAARVDRERALAYRDPMPESSTKLLARLREVHRAAPSGAPSCGDVARW